VPLGQGQVDLPRILQLLAERAPNPPVDLEIITGRPPITLDYLRPDGTFWRTYPGLPARDFARFVALAQAGKPEPLEQLIADWDPTNRPAAEIQPLLAQQRRHFEESVRYAREVLGLGERGRIGA
jgi:hypothetical protein